MPHPIGLAFFGALPQKCTEHRTPVAIPHQSEPFRDVEIDGSPERLVGDHRVQNVVLRRIPSKEFEALSTHLQPVRLKNGFVLERQSEPIRSAFFVNSGIASVIVATSNGKSVEVGLVGREGMIGLEIAAGFDEFTHEVVVQLPGEAFRIESDVFRKLLPSLPELTRILLRNLAIRGLELAQGAACNRLHDTKQRLARWLLLTYDRVGNELIATTHDFLSRMVGTDRPTVTIVLSNFEQKGLLECGRASIVIKDRNGLERQACECYRLFKRFYGELVS